MPAAAGLALSAAGVPSMLPLQAPCRSHLPVSPVLCLTLLPLLLHLSPAAGADLVVLPEMWNCPYSNDSFPTYAEDVDGGESPSAAMLAAAAADNRVVLVRWAGRAGGSSRQGQLHVQGSTPERRAAWRTAHLAGACGPGPGPACRSVAASLSAPTGAASTTHAWCTAATAACLGGTARWGPAQITPGVACLHLPTGRLLCRLHGHVCLPRCLLSCSVAFLQRGSMPCVGCPSLQVHLFDIDIPGKITFKESLTLTPGEGLTVVDTEARRAEGARGAPPAICTSAAVICRRLD